MMIHQYDDFWYNALIHGVIIITEDLFECYNGHWDVIKCLIMS